MIVICNAPDEVIKSVRMGTWCGSSVAEKMIANSIPLDKIRAEIAEITKKYPMTMDYENGLKEAIEIIDKYKAKSEGK